MSRSLQTGRSRNAFRVDELCLQPSTQGSSFLATLGSESESLWDSVVRSRNLGLISMAMGRGLEEARARQPCCPKGASLPGLLCKILRLLCAAIAVLIRQVPKPDQLVSSYETSLAGI